MASLVTRVLLTGASGFIGRHCLAPLLQRFDEVHIVGRQQIQADLLPNSADVSRIVRHKADLKIATEAVALVKTIRPTDLLHLAWTTETGTCLTDPDNELWESAGIQMVEAFHSFGGKRVVVSGTCAEYDWSFGRLSEHSTPLNPTTLYGRYKNSFRERLFDFAQQSGLSAAWGRIFFVFGPGEDKRRLVAYVITSLLNKLPAECTHGEQERDYLYVQDVADALVALLLSDVQGVVNIGSGRVIKLKELILSIADKLDGEKLIRLGAKEAPPDDPPRLEADITRLLEEVAFTPKPSMDAGMDTTIEWWRRQAY